MRDNEGQVVRLSADTLRLIAKEAHVGAIRTFESGATRDQDTTKPDYEGFISPLVEYRFGRYMNKHRVQSDGSLRASDNWQKGIPKEQYLKSLVRHAMDVRLIMRGFEKYAVEKDIEEALCALKFNVDGLLFEFLKGGYNERLAGQDSRTDEGPNGPTKQREVSPNCAGCPR